MAVVRAHELYMMAVHEGRASRAKKKNKPRTISDKQKIFDRDIPSKLRKMSIYEVAEGDLVKLVIGKGKSARVRANRLIAELKVFFGWAASLRGQEVGLESDPSYRLGDLRFPETPRSRKLDLQEIAWFLKAVAMEEERDFRRGMLLWLLTAARISELIWAQRLKVDFETAEAMLNHIKKGLERTYDLYELEDEMRAWFLTWENEIKRIAIASGVAEMLEVRLIALHNRVRFSVAGRAVASPLEQASVGLGNSQCGNARSDRCHYYDGTPASRS